MNSSLPRRDALAIAASYKIDPQRRELYVEGQRDRLFIQWLTEGARSPDARIVEARFVDSPTALGGERGRLVAFGKSVEHLQLAIRIWLDADHDRIENEVVGSNIYLTDFRDLEGYFLREDCFTKFVMLGLAKDSPEGAGLLAQVLRESRRIGLLRIVSHRMGLALPFQDTEITRYMAWRAGTLSVDFDRLLNALMQSAGIPQKQRAAILNHYDRVVSEFVETEHVQIAHGKDVCDFIRVVCGDQHLTSEQTARTMWTSLERAQIIESPQLARAARFLAGELPIP